MHRRDFLQACTAATMAGIVPTAAQAALQAPAPIRAGQIGTRHAHAEGQMLTLRNLPELYHVVGIVEPDEEQYEKVKARPAYQGLPRLTAEELLNTPELQVVAVETEVRDLLKTAQACVHAGKHIHLDKPAGESLEELRALHQAAAERGLVIQMGYMFRYNPAFVFLREAVRSGWLGQIFEVHGVISKQADRAGRLELKDYSGGSMFELGCHLIDPLIQLLGPPEKITPFPRRHIAGDPLFDNMLAVFEYPQVTATIRSSLVEVDGGRRRQFIVCGDQGTISILPLEPPALTLTLSRAQGEFSRGTHQVKLPKSAGRYHGAWEELAAVINGTKVFPYSYAHDWNVQKAILAASGLQSWE